MNHDDFDLISKLHTEKLKRTVMQKLIKMKKKKKASADKYQWLSIFVLVSKRINIINHVRRLI